MSGERKASAAATSTVSSRRASPRRKRQEEDAKASNDLLESTASAAEPTLSEDAVPGSSGTCRTGSVTWSHTDAGKLS